MSARSEITTDKTTVWVNSVDGMCIGRFSWKGVDVHHDYEAQARGDGECLDCVRGLPFDESWERFKESMLKFHGVTVEERYKPSLRRQKLAAMLWGTV